MTDQLDERYEFDVARRTASDLRVGRVIIIAIGEDDFVRTVTYGRTTKERLEVHEIGDALHNHISTLEGRG